MRACPSWSPSWRRAQGAQYPSPQRGPAPGSASKIKRAADTAACRQPVPRAWPVLLSGPPRIDARSPREGLLSCAGGGPLWSKSVVCLMRPPAVEAFRFSTTSIAMPLGLAYIAATLKGAGIGVHVVDAVGEAPTTRASYCKGYLVGLHLDQIVARVPPSTDI